MPFKDLPEGTTHSCTHTTDNSICEKCLGKDMTNNHEEIEKMFFDELAQVLERFFPKEKCTERPQALVLNAEANILFRKHSISLIDKERERVVKSILGIPKVFRDGEASRAIEEWAKENGY